MPKYLAAIVIAPALALAPMAAHASDLCARLEARLNQMPEVIGSGTAANLKAESIYRLNLLERAIKHDLRRLQCPTNSVIAFGAENAKACSSLGKELANVLDKKQSFEDLEPVMSQHVDDGTGRLPAILHEMRRAGCRPGDNPGIEGNVEIITQRSEPAPFSAAVYSDDTAYADEQQGLEQDASASDLDQQDDQQMTAALGDGSESEYGMPDDGSMIEVHPGDLQSGGSMSSVTLPKLEDTTKIPAPGGNAAAKPVIPAPPVASIPDRDYDPKATNVRRVGPSFLADDDHIDLKHPYDHPAN